MKSLCRCCSSVRKNLVPSMQIHIFDILTNFKAQYKIYHRNDLCTWFEKHCEIGTDWGTSDVSHCSSTFFFSVVKIKIQLSSNYTNLNLKYFFLEKRKRSRTTSSNNAAKECNMAIILICTTFTFFLLHLPRFVYKYWDLKRKILDKSHFKGTD